MTEPRTPSIPGDLREKYPALEPLALVFMAPGEAGPRIVDCNTGAELVFGFTRAEAIGQPAAALCHSSGRLDFPSLQEAMVRDPADQTGETVLIRASGESFPARFTLHPRVDPDGQLTSIVGVFSDLSAQEADLRALVAKQDRQEKTLADTQRRYFEFVNASSDLVSYWRMPPGLTPDLPLTTQVQMMFESVCIECNRACWESLGLAGRDDLIGVHYGDLLSESTMEDNFFAFVKNGYQLTGLESHERYPGGGEYFGLSNWYGVMEDGRLTHTWVSSKNMTDLKLAEAQIREETAFTTMALDAQEDTFFLFEMATGRALRWNRAFRETSGYSDQEIAGFPAPTTYYSPEDLDRVGVFMAELLTAGAGTIELDLIRKDGRTVPTEYRVSVIPNQAGEPELLISIGRDISERRQAEEERKLLQMQVHQAQKLDSIGRLAGGVAHDLNNLLTPILGFGEILQQDLDPDDPRRECVEEIRKAGLRARDLVGQLLAFSRKQTLEYAPVDMTRVVTDFEGLLRRTIREDIEIDIVAPATPCTFMADLGQIEQVVLNLAINGQDAMPEGGRLTLETDLVEFDESYVASHPGSEVGRYVMLAVVDTGGGMDADTQKHLFEPFFSTKGHQGTGLGLATVYGIVKQHGGHIWVESEPGVGTVFRVYLPAASVEAVAEPVAPQTDSVVKGDETVLLVEDNDQVRRLSEAILRRLGYSVLTAEDGPDALAVLEAHEDRVDLLLTDVVMPEMNGKELYDKLVVQRPDLRVLFMSGYTDEVIAHRGVLDEGTAFIQKPFTMENLGGKIRVVLGS